LRAARTGAARLRSSLLNQPPAERRPFPQPPGPVVPHRAHALLLGQDPFFRPTHSPRPRGPRRWSARAASIRPMLFTTVVCSPCARFWPGLGGAAPCSSRGRSPAIPGLDLIVLGDSVPSWSRGRTAWARSARYLRPPGDHPPIRKLKNNFKALFPRLGVHLFRPFCFSGQTSPSFTLVPSSLVLGPWC